MSQKHPALTPYSSVSVPLEADVIAAWKLAQSAPDEAARVKLNMGDATRLILLAVVAEHWGFMFDHLLPATLELEAANPQVWSLLLYCFPLKKGEGLQPYREFLERLEKDFQMSARWLVPNEEGFCAWDMCLMYARGYGVKKDADACCAQSRLAVLVERLETVPREFMDADHPLHPGISRKNIWMWGWCAFPMDSQRLEHFRHLLARGADPNLSLEVEGGPMSVGTAVVWARFSSRDLPVPIAQKNPVSR